MPNFLDGYGRGAGLVYDMNTRRRQSEAEAAAADEMRRAEIMRREYVNRQRKRETPAGPEFDRAGLAMPPAPPPAPPTPPVVPPNAPDTGIRLGVPRRRQGGPDINAPDPTNVDPRDNESIISRGARVQRGDADYPLRPESPVKSEGYVRSEFPKPGDAPAPTARPSGVTPPANRTTPTAATGGGRAIFLQGGTRNANGTTNTGDHAHISLPPHLQGRADEVAAFLRQNGVTVNSTVRTNNAGREHPVGNAIDIDVTNQAEADQVFQLIAQQFGGQTDAPAQSSGAGAIEQVFAAVQSGPEGLPYALQQLQDERYELEDRRAAALAAGVPDMISASSAALRELNTRTVAAFGAAAAMDIGISGNTELFSAYVREVTQRDMVFQPNGDGTYQVTVDGTLAATSMTRDEIQVQALSMVDAEYRQRNAETASERSMAEFESGLRRRENYESAMFDNMTRTQVARIEAEARRTTGANDVEFQDLENADGGSDTVMIYTNPETGQRVMRRVAIEPRRSPSVRGNGAEVPTLVTGTEVPVGG